MRHVYQGLILVGKLNPEIFCAPISVGAQPGKSDWSRRPLLLVSMLVDPRLLCFGIWSRDRNSRRALDLRLRSQLLKVSFLNSVTICESKLLNFGKA